LEKRTDTQLKENEQLKTENLALQKRLNMLEAKLNKLAALKEKEETITTGLAAVKQ